MKQREDGLLVRTESCDVRFSKSHQPSLLSINLVRLEYGRVALPVGRSPARLHPRWWQCGRRSKIRDFEEYAFEQYKSRMGLLARQRLGRGQDKDRPADLAYNLTAWCGNCVGIRAAGRRSGPHLKIDETPLPKQRSAPLDAARLPSLAGLPGT